ncbi:MAG TPA: glycine cleavage system protein H [Candidatus Angelobacter sp.]|nr:glycine cleavage system protein H [Candidatus Angelobacter sp.]
MSILFVLLTFLLILTYSYFRRNETPAMGLQPAPFQKVTAPKMVKAAGIEVPADYGFHLGHTWVRDEGQQNARVGIDGFAGNLFGQVDSVKMADLNRWVRQGQKLCTIRKGEQSVDMLSPVEGVLVSINHEVLKNPSLISDDPYKNGWLGVVKAPELSTNAKNLLRGPIVPAWLQESYGRLNAMLQPTNPGLAQDGGLPVKGAYFQVDSAAQRKLAKEFFLT